MDQCGLRSTTVVLMLPLHHLLAGMGGALYGAIPSTHGAACRMGQRLLEPSSPPFRGDLGAALTCSGSRCAHALRQSHPPPRLQSVEAGWVAGLKASSRMLQLVSSSDNASRDDAGRDEAGICHTSCKVARFTSRLHAATTRCLPSSLVDSSDPLLNTTLRIPAMALANH